MYTPKKTRLNHLKQFFNVQQSYACLPHSSHDTVQHATRSSSTQFGRPLSKISSKTHLPKKILGGACPQTPLQARGSATRHAYRSSSKQIEPPPLGKPCTVYMLILSRTQKNSVYVKKSINI